jgi:hypothetical protein
MGLVIRKVAAAVCAAGLAGSLAAQEARVHAVVDLAHEFSFYADGRFAKQYLAGHKAVTSWGTLYKFDLSNANLLVLLACAEQLRYAPEDVAAIQAFLSEGGGVAVFCGSERGPQSELAKSFGAALVKGARAPLSAHEALGGVAVEGESGFHLALDEPHLWTALVADADRQPVAAMRKVGKGRVLLCVRSLAGSRPDASDPRNAAWLAPVLQRLAGGKAVDGAKPFNGRGLTPGDYVEDHEGLKLHYSDYLKPYAQAMFNISQRVKPVLEKRMGVPLSEGMGSEIGLLATGGGGFSAGRVIGLAVWWGGFPEKEDSMIEFISHESTHSWVLPFPEIWNEPIATYVGNLVMIDMGYAEEANRRIAHTIASARRHDPEMRLYGIDGASLSGAPKLEGGALRDIHWGKTYWVWEELRKEQPDVVSRYFQAKRRLALPGKIKSYGPNETVAVLAAALGRDLFPWFREHGFDVARERSAIKE